MTSSRRPSSRATKRARRQAREQTALQSASTAGGRRGLSPMTLLTAGVVVVAAVVIIALALINNGGGGAPVSSPAAVSPVDLAHGRSLGNANAPVKLDLWADFQCPACDVFTKNVEPLLVGGYMQNGKAQLTFHDFSFIGPESISAAAAARCADQQGKFWPYHDYLYANQGATENGGAFKRDRLLAIGDAVGLTRATFSTCLDDTTILNAVAAETDQGKAQSVKQTPTVMVNGTAASAVDFASIAKLIDAALAGGSPAPSTSPAVSASASP